MTARARRRGEPLVMLGVLLAGWIAARTVLWEAPFARVQVVAPGAATAARPAMPRPSAAVGEVAVDRPAPVSSPGPVVAGPSPRPHAPPWRSPFAAQALSAPPAAFVPTPVAPLPAPLVPANLAAGHQLMYLAGLAQLPLPASLALVARPPASVPAALPPGLARASRWSGDGWLLWRRGSSAAGFAAAAGQASYGGSQAGAVLRYALAPASDHAPAAYVRLSRALAFDDGDAALGLSARPLAAIPLRMLAEGRVQRSGGTTRLRPAAALVSELPPQRLPLGAEAEVYAQAGYVGGKNATPFFDVQVAAERPLARTGPVELRAGVGAWAGGQDGATRFDLGPRATLRLDLGGAPSRLALDWRFRVAGNARPASGPALTFATGF